MLIESNLASLLERFFVKRLISERRVSPHTIASYRDTFRLLLQFATAKLKKEPSALVLEDLDAQFIGAFLNDLEHKRNNSARSRNLRLTAIRSFFRYASFEEPTRSDVIQHVLSIPSKKHDQTLIGFLTKTEIEALLAAPDTETWTGRRDRAFMKEQQNLIVAVTRSQCWVGSCANSARDCHYGQRQSPRFVREIIFYG